MGSSNETSCFGPVINPWRRPRSGIEHGRWCRAARRRLGGGGRRASLPRRHRDRHRRLDPPAGGVHRHRRHQADLRPLLALGHRRLCLVARPGRTDRAHGARHRDPAALDGRARSEGFDLGRSRGAGLRGRARQAGQRPDHRHPEGVPGRRHGGRDRHAVGAGRRVAEGRRAPRSSRCRCRTPSTRCRPTTSWRRRRPRRTSRAMTACATACAQPGRDVIGMYEKTRAERLWRGGAPAHHDRHLCALRRLLRRLLSAGAEGAHADQARLRGLLRQGRRRDPDAGDAVGRLRHRREGPAPIRSRCISTTCSR